MGNTSPKITLALGNLSGLLRKPFGILFTCPQEGGRVQGWESKYYFGLINGLIGLFFRILFGSRLLAHGLGALAAIFLLTMSHEP